MGQFIVTGQAAKVTGAGMGGKRRGIFGRLLRWAAGALALLVMVPVILVPLYTVVRPVSTLMVWSAVTGAGVDRRWIALDDIAPALVRAVLMSEDGRFCSHDGVDREELAKAIAGDFSRGASTIPMQTVKNLFLWQSRSFVRKGLEIPLAVFADAVWGKRRTMEIYLNIAEWGPGVFGAEAAAQHHFGRPAANLTETQAALLAVTLPNPYLRDPAAPSERLRARARIAAERARASGAYIRCLDPPASV